MKIVFFVLTIFLFAGCNKSASHYDSGVVEPEPKKNCERVSWRFYRCEYKGDLCYYTYEGGVHCKFGGARDE